VRRGNVRRGAVAVLACALAGSAGLAGAAPPADVAADAQLRARRDTYHPVIDLLRTKAVRLSDEQMEKLKGFPLEAVWASITMLQPRLRVRVLPRRSRNIQPQSIRPSPGSKADCCLSRGGSSWHRRARSLRACCK